MFWPGSSDKFEPDMVTSRWKLLDRSLSIYNPVQVNVGC